LNLDEFLSMGGHAGFVWPAYAAALLVLVGLGAMSVLRLARLRRSLAELEGSAAADRLTESRTP